MAESVPTTNTMQDAISLEEMRQEFPDANEADLSRWLDMQRAIAQLKERLPQLSLPPEGRKEAETLLSLCERHLDFKRPYTIAVVGEKGTGKSALINMFFGEYLLPSRDSAEAVTGTVVKVKRRLVEGHAGNGKRGSVYYDEAGLVRHIEEECEAHKVAAAFLPGDDSVKRLDIDMTLNALERKRSASAGRARGMAPPLLDDLIALLKAMKQHAARLKNGSETFDLNRGEELQEFHNRIDERTDDRSGVTRQTTLVDHAEIELISGDGHDGIAAVEMIDVPGTGVTNARHRKVLRRQLNPQNLDAIILVVAKGTRFGPEAREVMPLITSVIMEGVPPEKRLDFAERIFLVVNKDDQIYDEQQLKTDLINISAEICPGYWERYGSQNIFRLMADAGLIGKLLARHPGEGQRWLQGESPDYFPATLAGKGEQWAKTVNKFPDDCQAKESASERFLCGSGAAMLLARLNSFLRNTRLRRDFHEADVRYCEAGSRVYRMLAQQFKEIVKRFPSDRPLEDVQSYQDAFTAEFGLRIKKEVESFPRRFDEARYSFGKNERSLSVFKTTMQEVAGVVMGKVKAHTGSADFQAELLSGGKLPPADDIINYRVIAKGALLPLKLLDLYALDWLQEEVQKLSAAMVGELKTHIENYSVLEWLDRLDGVWDRAGEFKRRFEEKVLAPLQARYTEACRGAAVCRLLEFEVVTDITTGGKDKGAAGSGYGTVERHTSGKPGFEANQLKEQIDQYYQEVFGKLQTILNDWLFTFFLFLIRQDVEKEIKEMDDELTVALIQELANRDNRLHQYFLAEQSSQVAEALALAGDLESVGQFRSVVG